MDTITERALDTPDDVSETASDLGNVFRRSAIGVIVIGTDKQILLINPAALRQFGLESLPDEWQDLSVFFNNIEIHAATGERFRADAGPISASLATGKTTDECDCRIARPDGTSGWFRGCFAPVQLDSGEIVGATMMLLDVNDGLISRTAMENVARRAMHTQEEERARIAHQLNDDFAQQIAAVKMQLHAALRESDSETQVQECIVRMNMLLNSIRNLSMGLRPAELDDLGLISAIRWYLNRQQESDNVAIIYDADVQMPSLPPDVAIACFRIVQEAVSNALRHAGAQSLTVRLFLTPTDICVEVVDDGCGFDSQRLIGAEISGGGFGLIAMRERARLAGGQFAISSNPGQGTSITARFLRT